MSTADSNQPPERATAWTIPLLCAGIALIACCMIIPAADENHRLIYEREKLQRDLDQIQKQVAVNKDFLKRVEGDPNLLERLAQRQMKLVREGTRVLELPSEETKPEISPYLLVTLPPPAPLVPYRSVGGVFSSLCRQPRPQLFMMGAGLLLVAMGLILGSTEPSR